MRIRMGGLEKRMTMLGMGNRMNIGMRMRMGMGLEKRMRMLGWGIG